jgi:DNA-binding LytR/AlgR family response regulator
MINCLIVDDEPLARDIIQNFCSHLPHLRVVGACGHALEAKQLMEGVDLLFLDINLPVLDGLAFLKKLRPQPVVIFTTAYKDYAVTAFELDGCDYLVKPFSLERFIVAVDKAAARLKAARSEGGRTETEGDNSESIFIKADGKIYRVELKDILFAEARGNYTRVVTENEAYLAPLTFTQFEAALPKGIFARVHRSFIVGKGKIRHIEGNRVFVSKHEIPISNQYKGTFLRGLGLL